MRPLQISCHILSVLGWFKLDWPLYNGKAVLPNFASRRDMRLSEIAIRHFHQPSFFAICVYPKSLFGIFINPAFYRFGKVREIIADGFHRQVTKG